jgi:hypothetical protein
VRPEQAIDPCGKLDARARIRNKEPFPDRHVQRTAQYALLNESPSCFDLYALLEALAEIRFNIVSGDAGVGDLLK